jgi:sporulation protein YlmC with PRC-barrel domain
MRLKEILGLPVVDPAAARRIGTVSDYQVDPAAGRVAAIDVTSADGEEPIRILSHRIRRVGQHAVVLTGRTGQLSTSEAAVNERWLDSRTLEGLEVLGDDGNRVGRLGDARFNQDTLDVSAYLRKGPTFTESIVGRGRIQPNRVASCSRELMIVTSGKMQPAPATEAPEATASLGMPLKFEDMPEPVESGSGLGVAAPATDGHRVPAGGA